MPAAFPALNALAKNTGQVKQNSLRPMHGFVGFAFIIKHRTCHREQCAATGQKCPHSNHAAFDFATRLVPRPPPKPDIQRKEE